MCGIIGLWQRKNIRSQEELKVLAQQMTETIVHRGPDGSGIWLDVKGRCAFGHRRLSIIDTSSAGTQPFCSRDRRWWVTFNGEIYNFKDIRAQLEQTGHIFRSKSDTEVLVEALAEWGTSALEKFDGMFAFAAFDTHRGELLLARDRFGEKPLYYTNLADGTFAFASELRALEILPGFDKTISIDAMAEYLMFQYVGAPRSIYERVPKLPPAHLMLKSESAAEMHRYYRFDPGKDLFQGRSISDLADELETILVRSIERRLVADVPLGAFLSGGVDSSIVCALVTQKLRIPLNTYSIGFLNAPESEHHVARQFAKHLGTIHHEEIVSPNVDGFLDMAGKVLDEPNADSSCLPTYLLSRFARQDVTVAISGDGGDEMFGGYGRYSRMLLERDVHEIGELTFWSPGRYYGPSILIASESEVRSLLGDLPPRFRSHLMRLRQELNSGRQQLLGSLRKSDVENYLPGAVLPKVDRMSMQHSLEVRTPFLNVELAHFVERLPESLCTGRSFTKRLLRQLACRYLPQHLINLPKQGFGLPMADWTRNSLLPKAGAMLAGESVLRQSLGAKTIDLLLAKQSAASGFNPYQLWSIVVLEAWLRERDADIPVLSQSMSAARRSRSASKDRFVNWAIPVAEKTWIVTAGDPDQQPEISFEGIDQGLYMKLCELQVVREKPPANAKPATLQLNGNQPVAPGDPKMFAGAALIFLDKDAAVQVGARELRRLRALHVRRIILPHRSSEYKCKDIKFHYFIDALRNHLDRARSWLSGARSSEDKHPIKSEDFFTEFMKSLSDTPSDDPLVPGNRVVVLTHALPPGGAERQWVYLAKDLQTLGFEVTFVTLDPLQGENSHYLPILRSTGIESLQACDLPYFVEEARFAAQFPNGFSGFCQQRLLAQTTNALRLVSPRVVFAQLDTGNIVGAMAGLICGVDRVVVSFRNYNPSNFTHFNPPWFHPAYRAIASSPKVVLTGNFDGANDDYADWIGLPRSRIFTIPNALDRDMFTPASSQEIEKVRQELDLPKGSPVILGVFRFSDEKCPLDFTRVAMRLAEENSSLHILVAGVGPLEADVRQLISQSPCSDRFRLLGRREDVNALMSTSSLLLHAGKKEGMPNAIMEAMLSGLPVVATDAGASRDLVVEGETGFIRKIGDLEGLAESCSRLLAERDLGLRMKSAIAKRMKDQFSPEEMARRYLEATGIYEIPSAKLSS